MAASFFQQTSRLLQRIRRPFLKLPPRPEYGYAWTYYPRLIHKLGSALRLAVDDEFRRRGVILGVLPPEVAQRLREAIDCAPPVCIKTEDHDDGYVFNQGLGEYEIVLNRDHVYVQLGSDQSAALAATIEALRRPVTAAFGSRWRVVNTRCWKTPAGASESGPNAWHADGFPAAAPKLMVYVSGAGPEIGTTEIKTLDGGVVVVNGPPGAWVLFRNGDLQHRGIAPRTGQRVILELTLSPSLRFDPHPVFAGLNAKYPRRPWYRSANRSGRTFPHQRGTR